MTRIVVLTGSKSLLGVTADLTARPLLLLPLETPLSDEESEILEKNTGLACLAVHYPHYIEKDVIGGIIDVTGGPKNPE
jgi:hypothetical protein